MRLASLASIPQNDTQDQQFWEILSGMCVLDKSMDAPEMLNRACSQLEVE